jgi:hypothetical protein
MRQALAGTVLTLALVAPVSAQQTASAALTPAEAEAVDAGVVALKLEPGAERDCIAEKAKAILPTVPAAQVLQEGRGGALRSNKQFEQNPMILQLLLQSRVETAVQKARLACAKPAGTN